MAAIQTENMLRLAILQLEERQKQETDKLKTAFHVVYDGMKPANLIRNSVKDLLGSRGEKGTLIQTAVGMGAGFLVKRLFMGTSANPIKHLVGNVIQVGISNLVAQRPGLWNLFGKSPEKEPEDRAQARKTP